MLRISLSIVAFESDPHSGLWSCRAPEPLKQELGEIQFATLAGQLPDRVPREVLRQRVAELRRIYGIDCRDSFTCELIDVIG